MGNVYNGLTVYNNKSCFGGIPLSTKNNPSKDYTDSKIEYSIIIQRQKIFVIMLRVRLQLHAVKALRTRTSPDIHRNIANMLVTLQTYTGIYIPWGVSPPEL
jgi:hypothetical protein